MSAPQQRAHKSEGGIREMLRDVDNYWFGHGSPTALGVFRIIMGTLAFVNLLMIAVDFDAWFTERGFVPVWLSRLWLGENVPVWNPPDAAMFHGHPAALARLNLLNGVTDPRITIPFYVLVTLAALLTALGLWTRVSTIVLAVGIVTLHHRNAAILHGGDTVLRIMVMYLALAPCGRACSLDRLIRLWKGIESGAPVRVSLWVQRLITYNVALLYFTTVWLKWYGGLWKNGTATWYPARLAEFYRFPVPPFVSELPMVKLTTYGTLAVEFSMATLVFYRPARKWVLLAGILMHGYIEYSMNIPLFSYLMISMYVCFYDGEEIAAWAERQGERMKRWRMVVRLPHGMRLNPRAVAFFDAADPLKFVTYLPGDTETVQPSDIQGSYRRSLGAWVFGWVPGVWRRLVCSSLEQIPAEPALELPKKAKAKR